jgi:hypothetical protein
LRGPSNETWKFGLDWTLEIAMSEEPLDGGLHIDSDWKEEAAREKERLAKEEQTASRDAGAAAVGPASFMELLNLLAMQAAISLGGFQTPAGERIPPNPAAAKHHIDLLDVLDPKTKGNLTEEEQRTLNGVLHELRLQYVQAVGAGATTPPPGP